MDGFDVGCDFGNVSLGKETCRVGVKVERATMPLTVADAALCGKRLTGRLVVGGKSDAASQASLPGMEDAAHEVVGVFDVKRFGVSSREITFGATFNAGDVDARDLGRLANASGRIVVTEVAELPDDEDEDEDDDGPLTSQRTLVPSSPTLDDLKRDSGAALPLSELTKFRATKGIVSSVRKVVGGDTIAHLEKFMADNPEYWHRDIPGVGEGKITVLQDAHLGLRRTYPMVSDEDRRDIDQAFAEGMQAFEQAQALGFEDGVIAGAEPEHYPRGTPRYLAWERGWDTARLDTERLADEIDGVMDLSDDEPADSVEVE